MIENINNIDSLLEAIGRGYRPKYLFFWNEQPRRDGRIGRGCLSQWWPASFAVNGQTYPTAEHYMMAEKARLFGDLDALNEILAAPHPGVAKQLGRGVRGFEEQLWQQHRFEIVVRGSEAKFRQNQELATFLVNTQARVLVEASPVDPIWGIGLAEDDAGAQDPESWQGLNLLGFALMAARRRLLEDT